MIAYLDCSSGISGDMMLGALVQAGLSCEKLKEELACLKVQGYEIHCKEVVKAGISAAKVDVIVHDTTTHRKWNDVQGLIDKSTLSDDIKTQGLRIFKRLFEAEAKVHASVYDKVSLHELGAIDCLIDIFGALIGIKELGIGKIYSSSVNLGSGTVKTSHGIMPVPAPATAELLKGVSVYTDHTPMELTTPTGAVLVSSLVNEFNRVPSFEIERIGYGAGDRDIAHKPNVLRLIMGQQSESEYTGDYVTVIETNIDDMNPQLYDYTMDVLFAQGALDVFLTPIVMKKSRPAVKLTVLVKRQVREKVIDSILRETTSFGVRIYETERQILDRKIKHIDTQYGRVGVKVGSKGNRVIKESLEYEDLKKVSQQSGVSLNKVVEEARKVLRNYQENGED